MADVAHGGDQQAPGQLGRGVGDAREGGTAKVGVAHDHAVLGRGGHVQVGQAHADDGDQLQIGQSRDQGAGQGHPLAHGAQDVEGLQRLDRLRLSQMTVEHGDLGPGLDPGPVGGVQRHAGVVVENGDPGHERLLLHHSPAPCDKACLAGARQEEHSLVSDAVSGQ